MRIFLITSLLLSGIASAAEINKSCLNYNDGTVVLSGKVIEKTFFGPPGYGESPQTDSRETQLLLKLSKPICVNGSPGTYEDAEKNQLEITLVPLGDFKITTYLGKKISVKGELFHSFNGHHHTHVLIGVNSIK